FSFKGADGKPTGYSIDLCQRIVTGVQQQLKLAKLDVKWVPVTPDTRIGAVVNGTIDLECGSTTNTLSRQEQVDFSHMTFVDGGSLLIKSDRVAAMQDLGGKKIAVIPGTTTETAVRTALQKSFVTAQIVPVKDSRAGPAAVERGNADASARDRVTPSGLVVTAKGGQFATGEQSLS